MKKLYDVIKPTDGKCPIMDFKDADCNGCCFVIYGEKIDCVAKEKSQE